MLKRMKIQNNNNKIDKNTIHIAIKTTIIITIIKTNNIKILIKINSIYKIMIQNYSMHRTKENQNKDPKKITSNPYGQIIKKMMNNSYSKHSIKNK